MEELEYIPLRCKNDIFPENDIFAIQSLIIFTEFGAEPGPQPTQQGAENNGQHEHDEHGPLIHADGQQMAQQHCQG